MCEIADPAVSEAEVDRHGRAAKPRMRPGARVRRGEPTEPRDIRGELQNTFVIDIIQHQDMFFASWRNRLRPPI